MNLKAIAVKAAAFSLFVSGITLVEAPAHAFLLNSNDQLSVVSSARIRNFNKPIGQSAFIDFFNPVNSAASPGFGRGLVADASTGFFEAYEGSQAIIKDIFVKRTGNNVWEAISDIDPFITLTLGDDVTFKATKFVLTKLGSAYEATFEGFFFDANGTKLSNVANGAFSTQSGTFQSNGAAISLDIIPIPTPALLPGLIGMGVAALRKRRAEESETEVTEPIKA